MEISVYNHKGKKSGTHKVHDTILNSPWNVSFVHEVVVSLQSNARMNTSHTKDRSDVRGGGAKPWRQKGTGRARHGSRRSPLWEGGGVTFGPRNEKVWKKKINKKIRKKALLTALSQKVRDNQILFLNAFQTQPKKTKDLQDILSFITSIKGFETLNEKKHNNVLIVVPEKKEDFSQSVSNLAHVSSVLLENLNVLDVVNYRYLLIVDPEKTFEFLKMKVPSEIKK